ncbi:MULTISPECIES: GTPase Era [Anaerolinea]|uniref:GTPase Era n=1 Tax=Anaerolinea TaxID=233189 RepID=UPI0026364B9E|nr:GTPase Era [Anaerolinea thermophila]
MSEQPAEFKSGFVAVVGRPNVGKSTLMNRYLGQKIAAVSPRPQTTRRRQLGILTLPQAQIIFVDTPGIHKPVHKLGEYMNQVALDALRDADLILWLVDASVKPTDEDRLCAQRITEALGETPENVLLALNKVDQVPEDQRPARLKSYQDLLPAAWVVWISATSGTGTQDLLDEILRRLPAGPPYYEEEQITDLYEREIAADLIREAALIHLKDEVPHAIAVRMDEYKERSEDTAYIAATLLLEREAHKPIVIGKGGEMLKRIGTTARQEIEAMSGRKVYLDLRVKVMENWRDNPALLRSLGYVVRKE